MAIASVAQCGLEEGLLQALNRMQNEMAEPGELSAKKKLPSVGEKEAERRTGSCRDSNHFLANLVQGRVPSGRGYDADRQRGKKRERVKQEGRGRPWPAGSFGAQDRGRQTQQVGNQYAERERENCCLFTVTKRSPC